MSKSPQTGTALLVACKVLGDICLTFSDFARINADREAAGEALFANPRNAPVGGLNPISEVRSAPVGAMLGGTRLWSSQRLHQVDAVQELLSLVLPMIAANEVIPTSEPGSSHWTRHRSKRAGWPQSATT